MVASLTMKAQAPSDSVSIMFRHLQNTNTEVVGIQKSLVTHATMVAFGAGMEIGGLFLIAQSSYETPRRQTAGYLLVAGGLAVTVASFIPLATHKVRLDGNALVIHPSELKMK